MNRNELLALIKSYYDPARIAAIDADFLSFEEERTSEDDLTLLAQLLRKQGLVFKTNPLNSILLYVTGQTNAFDFKTGRAHTTGGAAPDIDIDMAAASRPPILEWITNEYGAEHIANIGTFGRFKPKSITNRFFKMTEEYGPLRGDVSSRIPNALFGREATIQEIVEGSPKKGYPANPELATDPKYADWYEFATKMEGMVANQGVHPAGILIMDDPVSDHIPTWKNKDYSRITQYDMNEVEDLG